MNSHRVAGIAAEITQIRRGEDMRGFRVTTTKLVSEAPAWEREEDAGVADRGQDAPGTAPAAAEGFAS